MDDYSKRAYGLSYYYAHKEKILADRKRRWEENPELKERALEVSRRHYHAKVKGTDKYEEVKKKNLERYHRKKAEKEAESR